ncbi:MAG: SGNH/GDSL hydrolase family protein [Pseudomonadota bacterium]
MRAEATRRAALRLLLGPALLWQGRKMRRQVLRLPEPEGARDGVIGTGARQLSLLILGDSATAGVGVATQADALSGQLTQRLADEFQLTRRLFAQTGWNTAEVLEEIAGLTGTYQIALISLGVNDVTSEEPVPRYLEQYGRIIDHLRGQHGVGPVIACAVPPMGSFPALPQPLRWYLGKQAAYYDRSLAHWCADQQDVHHLPFSAKIGPEDMAEDGFHPGAPIYRVWAKHAAAAISKVA